MNPTIRERRVAAGWSQAALAIEAGVSPASVSRLELLGEAGGRAFVAILGALARVENGDAVVASPRPRPRHHIADRVDAAAREVLRYGVTQTDAAHRFGVDQPSVSRRVRELRLVLDGLAHRDGGTAA